MATTDYDAQFKALSDMERNKITSVPVVKAADMK